MDIKTGARVSDYMIREKVRATNRLETYNATAEQTGNLISIHFVNPSLFRGAESRTVFLHEVKQLSAFLHTLNHLHICKILDLGDYSATAFLVTEYLESETIAERLSSGPLAVDEALVYGIQICDALDSLHAAGILHNDLNPANILLAPKGGIKLQVFHLAPWIHLDVDEVLDESLLEFLTYMAPEKIRGDVVDERSDIYSTGAILYFILTGRNPFEESNLARLALSMLQNEPLAPSEVRAEIPVDLSRIILTCLAKSSADRPKRAIDLMADLKQLLFN